MQISSRPSEEVHYPVILKDMSEKNYSTLAAYSLELEIKDAFALGNVQWNPEKVQLEQNYPNPFNPVTLIRFEIPEKSRVNLKIYNGLGKLVAVLKDDVMPAGSYEVAWDASLMPGGNYHYKLQVNHKIFTKTMTLVN